MSRIFWRNFFRLVVLTAAVAEWVCLAWVVIVVFGVSLPWPVHFIGPAILHTVNRRLLRGGPPRSQRAPLVRAYTAFAFTCLFGFLALAVNGALWGSVAAALHLASNLGAPLAAADVLGPASLTGSVALFVVSAALAHAYGPGQRDVRVLEFEARLPGLDPAFDGFRIVQLSDIHLGNFMDGEALAPYVEQVRALDADLVCITGDICDGLHHAPATLPVLGRLKAREGVVAILGNHDVYTGADAVTEALRDWCNRERGEGDAPFVVLRNERLVVERGGAHLHVLGLDDAGTTWARGVREHDALWPLAATVPAGEPTLLLSHRPDLFPQAVALGIGLVLSGHTHGGQLAVPWPGGRPVSLARFISDYPRGNYREEASLLHVNLGLGVTAQPVRLFSPREITLITLRCNADAACQAAAPRQPTGGIA